MFPIFWRFIKDKKYIFVGYLIGSVAFLEMYVALFPSFSKVAQDKINLLMQSYPKEIWTVMGLDPAKLSFGHIESFVATEQYSFIWPILLIILAISLANAAIVSDIEKGTIELILAQPISRLKIYLSRYLAGAAILTVFVFSSVYAIIPLTKIHHVPMYCQNNLTIAISGLLLSLSIYSIAMFASSIFSDKGKVSFITAGFVILTYVLNILAGLKDALKDLKYVSFFHYYSAMTNFVDNQFVAYSFWFFMGLILAFSLLGALWFNRRDITV
jgi:ABC-2 type transport system permease protein